MWPSYWGTSSWCVMLWNTSLGNERMLWGTFVWFYSNISAFICSNCFVALLDQTTFRLQSILVSWFVGMVSTNSALSEESNQSFNCNERLSECVITFSWAVLYSGLDDYYLAASSWIKRLSSYNKISFSRSRLSYSFWEKYFFFTSSNCVSSFSRFYFRSFLYFLNSLSFCCFYSVLISS